MTELKDFEKEKKTISLAKANIYSALLLVPTVIIYLIPFYLLWKEQLSLEAFNNLFAQFGVTTGFSYRPIVYRSDGRGGSYSRTDTWHHLGYLC